ncbi:unnamed protein product [Ectocarpus fasciculatus]
MYRPRRVCGSTETPRVRHIPWHHQKRPALSLSLFILFFFLAFAAATYGSSTVSIYTCRGRAGERSPSRSSAPLRPTRARSHLSPASGLKGPPTPQKLLARR